METKVAQFISYSELTVCYYLPRHYCRKNKLPILKTAAIYTGKIFPDLHIN